MSLAIFKYSSDLHRFFSKWYNPYDKKTTKKYIRIDIAVFCIVESINSSFMIGSFILLNKNALEIDYYRNF